MNRPQKIEKAPLFVGLAAFGGAGVGALAGGVAGVLVILTMTIVGAINGDSNDSQYSGFAWTLFTSVYAFVFGAICGAVLGAIGGFLLGLLFCFARNRWMGAVGGALFGALTALCFGDSAPALKFDASSPIFWGFAILCAAGGAAAGALLTRLLFHLIDQESQTVA